MKDLALFRLSPSNRGKFVKVAAASLAFASLAAFGCEDLSSESGAAPQPVTGAAGADADGDPGARSTLGKAKERAERLVNEEVAEYNRKLEEAIDGKYP